MENSPDTSGGAAVVVGEAVVVVATPVVVGASGAVVAVLPPDPQAASPISHTTQAIRRTANKARHRRRAEPTFFVHHQNDADAL
jgi:hypothetical protein